MLPDNLLDLEEPSSNLLMVVQEMLLVLDLVEIYKDKELTQVRQKL